MSETKPDIETSLVEETRPKPIPAQLMADSNGMVIGNSLEERYRVCSLYSASGMLPKGYDTPEKVFAGIQYALELGFRHKPLTALRNIAIINGQPSLWGELPLALVISSGLLTSKDEYFIDIKKQRLEPDCPPDQVWAAVCELGRKGMGSIKSAYTEDDRTKLGVAAIWQSFKKVMMKRKARAIAIKDHFPDIMLGIGIVEYDHHIYLDEMENKNVNTGKEAEKDRAAGLTEKYSGVIEYDVTT